MGFSKKTKDTQQPEQPAVTPAAPVITPEVASAAQQPEVAAIANTIEQAFANLSTAPAAAPVAPTVQVDASAYATGNPQPTIQPQQGYQMNQQPQFQQQTQQTGFARTSSSLFSSYNPWLNGKGDHEVKRLIDMTKELITANDSGELKDCYMLHAISREKQTGSFSAMVLTIVKPINGVNEAMASVFIIEKSRSALEPQYTETPAGKIEVFIPAAEAFNDNFKKAVEQQIRSDYKQAIPVTLCGLQVISRDVEIKEQEDLFPYINNAVNSITMFYESTNPLADKFTLLEIVNNKELRVNSRTSLGVQDYSGSLPVRSDIVSELTVIAQTNNGSTAISEQRDMVIAQSAAYVDLIYTPPNVGFNPYMPQQQAVMAPHFIPRITITKLATDLAGSSLEFALLGLANITVLGRNKAYGIAWKQAYANANNGEPNLRDFGAVGLLVPGLAEKPCVIDVSESDQTLRALMDVTLNPNPVYTLEVEQSGLNSWLTAVFADASRQDKVGVDARRAIIAAADRLTGNHFGNKLAAAAQAANISFAQLTDIPLTVSRKDQNFIGYYTRNGQKRDLRELDTLAMLNLAGSKDPDAVGEFMGTYNTQEDVLIRLDRRKRILERIASNMHIQGYSTKYDLTNVFVTALIAAIEATGLQVNNNQAGLRGATHQYQNAADWASVMTNPNLGTTMFSAGATMGGFQQTGNGWFGNPTNGAGYYHSY